MQRITRTILTIGLAALIPACASNTGKGAVIGGATGAVVGGVIGNQSGNTAAGAIIGAAVGGAAGAAVGNYMDRQADELAEDLEGAKIERIGEGIKITFDSPVDEYRLNPLAKEDLADMSGTLNKYEDTVILIEGHADATGPDDYNLELSRDRAASVADYLVLQGVDRNRMSTVGYGESQPVADNDTFEGRRQNRRVEVAIWANEELKEAAREQTSE